VHVCAISIQGIRSIVSLVQSSLSARLDRATS
jgi:hypothetical protein